MESVMGDLKGVDVGCDSRGFIDFIHPDDRQRVAACLAGSTKKYLIKMASSPYQTSASSYK